jgi:AraC-like DNA-binding protein
MSPDEIAASLPPHGILSPRPGAGPSTAAMAWQDLGGVLAAADELGALADTDQMLRRAVELARERIGLERVSIYLRDPRSERLLLRGTWGTSPQGETTDEHSIAHECNPLDAQLLCNMQVAGSLWIQHEPREGDTEPPRSWWMATPLVAAHDLIGVMYNDNALSHSPIDHEKQARAAVFCSLLAGLLLQRRVRLRWPRSASSDPSPTVKRALRLLDQNPSSTGESLARELSISASYLARSFKSEMGVSLVEFRNRRLMERFFQSLERGNGNLLAAALDAGFGSYTQFYRVYRKMFGKSPRQQLSSRSFARGPRPTGERSSSPQ